MKFMVVIFTNINVNFLVLNLFLLLFQAGARTSNLAVSCAVYNFDGSEILATYSDEDIYIFNNHPPHNDADQDFLHRFQGHRNNQTGTSIYFICNDQLLRSQSVRSTSDFRIDFLRRLLFCVAKDNRILNIASESWITLLGLV